MAELTFIPDCNCFSIRDAECDVSGARDAIDDAYRNVAAGNEHEIYVICAQDGIPIHLDVVIGDEAANSAIEGDGQLRFTLTCPSGDLVVGDPTGTAVGVELPDGPRIYEVELRHHGRAAAKALLERLYQDGLAQYDLATQRQYLNAHAGVERYVVRIRYGEPLHSDEDDE